MIRQNAIHYSGDVQRDRRHRVEPTSTMKFLELLGLLVSIRQWRKIWSQSIPGWERIDPSRMNGATASERRRIAAPTNRGSLQNITTRREALKHPSILPFLPSFRRMIDSFIHIHDLSPSLVFIYVAFIHLSISRLISSLLTTPARVHDHPIPGGVGWGPGWVIMRGRRVARLMPKLPLPPKPLHPTFAFSYSSSPFCIYPFPSPRVVIKFCLSPPCLASSSSPPPLARPVPFPPVGA